MTKGEHMQFIVRVVNRDSKRFVSHSSNVTHGTHFQGLAMGGAL